MSAATDSTNGTGNGYAATPSAVKAAYDLAASKADPADIPGASASTPLMDGTASAGSEEAYARGDHRHPTDTSRAPTSHRSTGTTYGAANASYYGHVRLSDATNSSNGTGNGYAATPSAVKAAYDRGTEGVNAAATAQATANAKADKWSLLWTNSAPTASFAAQTITLSQALSGFTAIIVLFSAVATGRDIVSTIIHNGATAGWMSNTRYDGGQYTCMRQFTPTWTGSTIVFGAATQNGSTNNSRCTPVKIYGIP